MPEPDFIALDHARFHRVDRNIFVRRVVADCMSHQCVMVADEGAPLAHPRPLLEACYLAWVGRSTGRSVRVAVTALFGLVHGFAFAGPLADLALPGPALATALLGFNLGIELAQLALLALGWLVIARARRWAPAAAGLALDVAAALAMAPAVYWVVTRAA